MIDLRSDTLTKPSPQMLEAMLSASVGDDVYGEDETVNLLEQKLAGIFGMEEGLFCPSGTMSNQLAIKTHTQPGQEVVCERNAHTYRLESGGIAFHSGCSVHPIDGHFGRITAQQVEESITPKFIAYPQTSVVCLENTTNLGGGSCYDREEMEHIKNVCTKHGLALHLDGARVFNAIVAMGEDPKAYGNMFNSISVCLSKGLGAPIGSVLLGNKSFILKARWHRKLFGGGMRQAGYLAAAGIYALDNNIKRLEIDHHHARILGEVLTTCDFVQNIYPIETNIIVIIVKEIYSVEAILAQWKEKGLLASSIGADKIRLVTHLGVSVEDIDKCIELIKKQ